MLLLNSMNSEHINKLDAETLELFAEAAHKIRMEGKLRDGWKYGDARMPLNGYKREGD